ncbi:potassium transporter TrkA [Glaciihabitans arcticus]|uniref:Potassium transporter TrkA n=1 Tax=Glaciihabitans arcticus TaxID=2668039 RepID=A0A4Q9GV14_9MICO|nr:NAD-binding protein [Glaciihabitans arcticus]TBN56433.1 potassium transporter TrkA [Glaciihabitans arcticus]
MNKPGFTERFRYWFDNVMSKGTVAIMGLLALASLAFIAVVAAIVVVFQLFPPMEDGADKPDFGEIIWGNLMRTLDSGTMGGDEGWAFRWPMLVVTVGGVIIVASLIGIISSAFDSKVEELRKGRSKVLEKDHTLVLGWSNKVFPILSEVCIANESRGRSVIVVLADRDKVEMEDEIRAKLGKTGKTRIIVRSGDPMDLTDLALANPNTARSIILLAPEGEEDPDSVVIKTALAITNNSSRKDGEYHIVGEIQDPANLEAANLVGRHEADWVLAGDLISRITVQTSRQSGLSVVYTELLDFDGDEIYFTDQPTLVGKTYFETQLAFAESTVIGISTPDGVLINPAPDTMVEEGSRLIVIAEDDSLIRLAGEGIVDPQHVSTKKDPKPAAEQTLILGYNSGLHTMLRELAEYVAPGSKALVVADVEKPQFAEFENLSVEFIRADATSRATLAAIPVVDFAHIIVLAYKDTMKAQRADAKTLITLLHLRDIADESDLDLNIVSEMIDDRNRELAEVTRADDFIVSDKLISLMLSQLSEDKSLAEVFATLFSSVGSEIYLRAADLYVVPGTEVDFYTVLEAARRRGETAIGYRLAADSRNGDADYGVTVNPRKARRLSFLPGDKIIVLAED